MESVNAMYRALKVITKDPKIRAWLEANDPKALAQCEYAVDEYEVMTQDQYRRLIP